MEYRRVRYVFPLLVMMAVQFVLAFALSAGTDTPADLKLTRYQYSPGGDGTDHFGAPASLAEPAPLELSGGDGTDHLSGPTSSLSGGDGTDHSRPLGHLGIYDRLSPLTGDEALLQTLLTGGKVASPGDGSTPNIPPAWQPWLPYVNAGGSLRLAPALIGSELLRLIIPTHADS